MKEIVLAILNLPVKLVYTVFLGLVMLIRPQYAKELVGHYETTIKDKQAIRWNLWR